MEAKELRIGNYVLSGVGVERVWQLWETKLVVGSGLGGSSVKYNEVEPIPLTEEWLLRFGFEKKDKGYFKDGFFCYLVYGGGSGWKTWVNMSKDNFTLALVGQVHQLQNLYFALTGQELDNPNR